MKLKNSYILLIAMAIFLLVSVGSVCASEDITTDDVNLADDGSSVILSDESSTDTTEDTTQIETTIDANDVKINENDNKTIPITVKDNESNPIEITKENLTVSEGNKTIGFTYNNSEITITDKLANGNHSLIINFLNNTIYKNSTKTIVLSIFGNYTIKSADSINVNSTKTVEIPLNITNAVDNKEITSAEFTGKISYTVGNNTTTVDISGIKYENGKLIFDYPLLDNITSSTLTLVYTDSEEELTKNITLKRIFNAKIELINTVNEYQNGNFTFRLIDIDSNEVLEGKKITLYTTGNIRAGHSATTDADGIATFRTTALYEFDSADSSFSMKQFEVGNHTVELSTESPVIATKVTTNLTITKTSINIKIENFKEYYGTNKNVTITVTNANNGQAVPGIILHLYMPQTSGKDYYFQTDSNGQSKISVKSLVGGTYNITVSNNDTTNINSKKVSGSITITPIPVKITAKDVTVTYNTGSTATIKITNKSTGKAVAGVYVLVIIDNNSKNPYLFQTNSKGEITFSASLKVGTHKMQIQTADSRYSASSAVTKTITVKKASAKIVAPKVTAYYKQGKYFTITLKNSKNNKAIYDAKLNIRVYISSTRYYNYNGNTGSNGQLKLSIDLNPGTYKVEVRGADSKDFSVSKATSKIIVKKAPAKLTPKKLTAKKGKSTYFKVTVKNTKTKKVISGVKVKIKVYTGKKYKTYTVKTNSKGIAQINVKSLKVGTHKVVVTSANKYVTAKTAKSTIKITKK